MFSQYALQLVLRERVLLRLERMQLCLFFFFCFVLAVTQHILIAILHNTPALTS